MNKRTVALSETEYKEMYHVLAEWFQAVRGIRETQ